MTLNLWYPWTNGTTTSDVGGGDWGVGGGTNRSGVDSEDRPNTGRPGPPSSITITLVGDFTIRIDFKDAGSPQGYLAHNPIIVDHWDIHACPISLGGTPTDAPAWRNDVLAKSHVVGSVGSQGDGGIISVSITDESLLDCYIQVVGISIWRVVGGPSVPLSVYASGFLPTGPLDPVTEQAVTLTLFTDTYSQKWVDIATTYKAPADIGRFAGVALHETGYLGSSELKEIGNLLTYAGGGVGGSYQRNIIRVPWDTGHAATLYFVSVDRAGKRRTDPLAAPSVVLAAGITA